MRMILICLGVCATALAGCGGAEDGERLDVVATTGIAADIVRQVAGPNADVESLLPVSASPHDYGASAKDRARLEDADLVVAWGSGLEAGLQLEELDPKPLELSEDMSDPHVWMDPTLVAESLPELSAALGKADPDHEAAYRRRADAYGDRLAALDREIRRTVAAVPADRRKLVTSHDALGHFVRRYGFEFVGAPFGLVPGSEASAEKVAALIDRVESQRVPAVFAEDTDDPKLMRQIAREAGVEVIDDLHVEGLRGSGDSYEEMLRFDARRIATALTG